MAVVGPNRFLRQLLVACLSILHYYTVISSANVITGSTDQLLPTLLVLSLGIGITITILLLRMKDTAKHVSFFVYESRGGYRGGMRGMHPPTSI